MYTHTLLLVDDSITTQQEIRSAFAGEPIQVVVAVNGHRALDRIEADRPDVVLASTTALGVDGYGLAHYVSQRSYLRNVAVLLLTGAVEPIDVQRLKESGARGIVEKPIESGVVISRVKEALMPPEPASQVDEFGQLTTAFDAIDASMISNAFGKGANTQEIAITPEALARIVNEAVAHAIAAYEQARGLAPEPARDSTIGSDRRAEVRKRAPLPKSPQAFPPSPWRAELLRLQGDMGLNDIEFEEAPPPPVEPVVNTDLSAQMGVDDFAFEDAPPSAAERVVAADASVDVVELTPPPDAAVSPTTLQLDNNGQLAATEHALDDAVTGGDETPEALTPESSGDFEFGADDLPLPARAGVEPISSQAPEPAAPETFAASPVTQKENDGRTEESGAGVTRVLEPLRGAVVLLGTAVADRASRFRSALADRAQRRAQERAAAIPAAEPVAPAVPAPPQAELKPAPEPPPAPKAPSVPLTPEEAAKTVFFTFDPIPPVPPRIPREPRKD
jgi:CheY-like chemotaxis protein